MPVQRENISMLEQLGATRESAICTIATALTSLKKSQSRHAPPCAVDDECPSNFRCDGIACTRVQCTDDLDCDGFCVLGSCFGGALGECRLPSA